jgi:hypothetical protein
MVAWLSDSLAWEVGALSDTRGGDSMGVVGAGGWAAAMLDAKAGEKKPWMPNMLS